MNILRNATTTRVIARTVTANAIFDGATNEDPAGYNPAPTQPGLCHKAGGTVGVFGFGVLGGRGNAVRVVKTRIIGQPQPGDKVEIRSGVAGQAPAGDVANDSLQVPAGYAPQNQVLEVLPLPTNFDDAPTALLGPLDRIAVFHNELGHESTVEFMVIEGDTTSLAALVCCCDGGTAAVPPPPVENAVDLVFDEDNTVLEVPAFNADIVNVRVNATARGQIRLPDASLVKPGQEINIFRVSAGDGIVHVITQGAANENGLTFVNVALPLAGGALRVKRTGPVATFTWAITSHHEVITTTLSAGDYTFNYGHPELRLVRWIDADPSTLRLPSYGTLMNVPIGCRYRVVNRTAANNKTVAAAGAEFIVGLGADANTLAVPSGTARDLIFDGTTWIAL